MGKKPVLLPIEKSDLHNELNDWSGLSGNISGRLLFRAHFYDLITGKMAVLEKTGNVCFYEQILSYVDDTLDINFLPALRRIATGARFSESLRQRASELSEIIEEGKTYPKNGQVTGLSADEAARAETARRILAGVRYPQTTEILRLLRDKSPWLRRLGICLIGKFRIKDMIQEVCDCLAVPEISDEAYSVMTEFGSEAGKELIRYYLRSSGNLNASRSVLRLFSEICPGENMPFVFERLWTNSRPLRELAAICLIKCSYKPSGEEREQLKKLIFDAFGQFVRMLSLKVCLDANNNEFIAEQIGKELQKWRKFLLNLLIICHGDTIVPESSRKGKQGNNDRQISALADIVYVSDHQGKKSVSGIETDRKTLKKLRRYFLIDAPHYDALPEEIINYDYNLIGVWTKACTLRGLKTIGSDSLLESVTALLFSHEWILKEEAAGLLKRSGKKMPGELSERLAEPDRLRIDKILEDKIHPNGFLYEKTRFLSSVFNGTGEEKLLFLAGRMMFFDKISQAEIDELPESLIWIITKENQINVRYISDKRTEESISGLIQTESCCYALPLTAIELFRINEPHDSFVLFKKLEEVEQ